MKTQTQFKNASLVSVINGSIVVKDSTGGEHTFVNASVVSVNNGTIIIESEWEPKEGELIKMEGNGTNCYAIFKNIEGSFLHDYGYRFFRENQLICNPYGWDSRNVAISPVTPEEQKAFDDFCKSQGKIWNKETLQWEKYKWMPKRDEKYWYVETTGEVMRTVYNTFTVDPLRIAYGNCFQTKEQAEKAAEKVKDLLKSL